MKKILASSVVSASLLLIAQFAAAAVVLNERTEFSFIGLDSCTGELVSIEGVQHVQFTPFDQEHGAHFRANSHGTGLGLDSGTTYVFNDRLHQDVKRPSDGGFVQTITQFVRLTSRGSAPNLFLSFTTVLIVDADGNLTIESTVDEVCRGR